MMKTDLHRFRSLLDPEGYPASPDPAAEPLLRCMESPGNPPRFLYSERHIQCLWADRRLIPSCVQTQTGESVRILEPGIWNLEAGPDFANAVFTVGRGERRMEGDVEVHIRAGDWNRHRHRADPRYHRTAAHVTWFPGMLDPRALPPGCLQIALAPAMEKIPGFSFDKIDITAYPHAVPRFPITPCAATLNHLPVDVANRFLEAAGRHRIHQKAERFRSAMHQGMDRADVLYHAAMSALGYKRNATAFRELADRVPLNALRKTPDPDSAYALLLGVAGLIPPHPSGSWPQPTRQEVRRLWDRWWPMRDIWQDRCMAKSDWNLGNMRPANHPVRRLVAAASIFGAGAPWLDDPVFQSDQAMTPDRKNAAVERLTTCNRIAYWSRRTSFTGKESATPIRLLSRSRAAGLLINVVLPLRLARGLDAAVPLDLPPEPDNAIIRECAHRLLGRDHNPSQVGRSGLRQQGLIQIFLEFCLASRSVCDVCPLPDCVNAFARAKP